MSANTVEPRPRMDVDAVLDRMDAVRKTYPSLVFDGDDAIEISVLQAEVIARLRDNLSEGDASVLIAAAALLGAVGYAKMGMAMSHGILSI